MRAFFTTSLAAALLGLSLHAHSQTAAVTVARVGTFKQVQGEAWVGSRAADRRSAVSGEGVQVSQRMSTGKTGAATLTLKDGTVVTMGPNSTMDLSTFEFNTTTRRQLPAGPVARLGAGGHGLAGQSPSREFQDQDTHFGGRRARHRFHR